MTLTVYELNALRVIFRGCGRSTLVQPKKTGNRPDMTGKLLTGTYIASTQKSSTAELYFCLEKKGFSNDEDVFRIWSDLSSISKRLWLIL